MGETSDFKLPLPDDGQVPWGQDYRDALNIIDAGMPSIRASMHIEDNTQATVIETPGVFVKANLPGVEGHSPCACISFNGNRMTYTLGSSPHTRTLTFVASWVVDAVGNNQTIQVCAARNGVPDLHLTAKARDTSGGDFANGTIVGLVQDFEPGEYLELWVANNTSSNNLVVSDVCWAVRG